MSGNALKGKKRAALFVGAVSVALFGSDLAMAHVNVGRLDRSGTATFVAQSLCGSNENGATAYYSFRIKGALAPLQITVTSPNANPSSVTVKSSRKRVWSGWGNSNGGNGAYTLTISKVVKKAGVTAFELEHHCSAANGGHTEHEGFVRLR